MSLVKTVTYVYDLTPYTTLEEMLVPVLQVLPSKFERETCTANVFAVKVTGFPCVPLEPCKVHVFITGKWVPSQSL